MRVQLTRVNGSIFEREDWMPSTAIDSLGEIEVPRNLWETEQRQKVAQIERQWRDAQPTLAGEKILLPGYETHILDTNREIEYNKLSMSQQGDVAATMHRPLREGKPLAFHGLEGISPESLEETNGQCVSHQLSKHIKIKGKAPWTQEQISEMLVHVTEELYEDNPDNPYDGRPCLDVGFTAAAITQLCREIGILIHIKWGSSKIESYIPERSQYESVALYIYGDHCYTVADPTIQRAMMKVARVTWKSVTCGMCRWRLLWLLHCNW